MAADPYKYFRIEARELAEDLGRTALDLEKAPGRVELVARILRLAHTLKGAARVVKQRAIADAAHQIEEALAPFREGEQPVARDSIEAVFGWVDGVGRHLSAIDLPTTQTAPTEQLKPTEEGVRTVRADLGEIDGLLDGLAETHVQVNGFRKGLTSIERAGHLARMLVGELSRRRDGTQSADAHPSKRALALAEELTTLCGGLERSLTVSVEQMDRELRQARDTAEQLRLIPVSAIFTALERTARDAAQVLGKEVDFEARGGDVRLDAHVLDRVQPALVQAVRNAVAHGIEKPTARLAQLKPRRGKVTIAVARRGRRVVLQVTDDGGGVDIEAVRAAAVRRGIDGKGVAALDVDALLAMLLRGGISTSSGVTEVAGRGVGLDVVREATAKLGGVARVKTERGRGTTIELSVPLSVAALEGLVVEHVGIEATIPLDSVRHAMKVDPSSITRSAHGDTLVHEGAVIPFVALSRALSVTGAERMTARAAIVVESAGALAAIGVDRVHGTSNIVLRPLPELAPCHDVVAGASLDAEGTPKLVLDPDALVGEARKKVAMPAPVAETRRLPVLIVDDSLTTRMLERSILESAGYEVDVAVSGEEGLSIAAQRKHALFLVDVEMPGIDGFEFVSRVRSDPELRHVPAVLVTSRVSEADLARGIEVGAQGHLAKSSFDQTELLGLIARLVSV